MGDEKPVDQEMCSERMGTVTDDLKEMKADIKTILARTNAYSSEAVTVKESLNELWTQFNDYREKGNNDLKKEIKDEMMSKNQTLCKDTNDVKTDLKNHIEGHWKWVAVSLGIMTLLATLVAIVAVLLK